MANRNPVLRDDIDHCRWAHLLLSMIIHILVLLLCASAVAHAQAHGKRPVDGVPGLGRQLTRSPSVRPAEPGSRLRRQSSHRQHRTSSQISSTQPLRAPARQPTDHSPKPPASDKIDLRFAELTLRCARMLDRDCKPAELANYIYQEYGPDTSLFSGHVYQEPAKNAAQAAEKMAQGASEQHKYVLKTAKSIIMLRGEHSKLHR